MPGRIIDTNFYAEDLMNSLVLCLHVARKKLGLLIDLFHFAVEDRLRKRINTDLRFLPKLDAPKLGLWNINANVDLIFLKKRGDRRVGSDQVAWPDIEHFHNGRGRRDDLALAETRLVESISCFGLFNVFAAVTMFHFFQICLRLEIARLG